MSVPFSFTVLDHQVDDQRFGETQHIAKLGCDDLLNRGFGNDLGERVAKIFHHDNNLGAGIHQLMLELAGGIQGIGVNDRKPGAQDGENCDRVLQHVRHHDSDPIALFPAPADFVNI